jgi:methionyl-tRNA formyltransferase
MNFCLLTSMPSAAIQFLYFVQTQGVRFTSVVCIGDGGERFEILKEYARTNRFDLYFTPSAKAPETVTLLQKIKPDVLKIITGEIIRRPVLEIPAIGTVNTHAGILPDYRGIDSAYWAVIEGKKHEIGVTVHFVDEGIDTGEILVTNRLQIAGRSSRSEILYRNHHELKWQSAAEALRLLQSGSKASRKQIPQGGKQYFEMHPKLLAIVDEILGQ